MVFLGNHRKYSLRALAGIRRATLVGIVRGILGGNLKEIIGSNPEGAHEVMC